MKFFAHTYPHSYYHITGKDPLNFLQGQLTCDVREVSNQNGNLTGYCNYQGRLLCVGYLSQYQDGYLLAIPGDAGAETIAVLNKFALFSKIKITDLTKQFKSWLIYDPEIAQFFAAILSQEQAQEYCVNYLSAQSLEIYSTSDPWDLSSILLSANYLLADNLWNYPYIAAKVPIIYRATWQKFLPHPLGLPELGAISFKKGCYVGQEIIARTHYRGKVKLETTLLSQPLQPQLSPGAELNSTLGQVIDCVVIDEQQLVLALQEKSLET